MCWSFAASAFFALIGSVFALRLAYKKESKFIWIPLLYFALMEGLQAVTYLYLGTCSSSGNQLLTFLSYMHIAFQPIFINAFVLYFIPLRVRNRIIGPVLALAALTTVLLLIKVYPFAWAGSCIPGTAMCGPQLCSYMGNWHLAWSLPFNGIGGLSMMTYYLMAAFLLPLLYGAWKTTVVGVLIGPVLAYILTQNPNEWPAVWCLISIWIILAAIATPLRTWLHVHKWYFWNYP